MPPGATIDKNGDVARQHDEEALHRRAFRDQHLPLVEMSKGPVRDQPQELLARRRADGLVPREPIDEIRRCHLAAP